MRQLVEAGADIAITDSRGVVEDVFSPLHYAFASDVDSDAKAAYLTQRSASSQPATDGSEQEVLGPEFYSTSLRLASLLNQADRVRALIDDHGASVNATDWRDRTALHFAAEAGSAEAVSVLVQHPFILIQISDPLLDVGCTPLHLAAWEGHADAVNVLVQHPRCHVNTTGTNGWTALHHAAYDGNLDCVKVLVSHTSCDVSITDYRDRTAADLARDRGHDDIVALLEAKSTGNFAVYLQELSCFTILQAQFIVVSLLTLSVG